MNKSKTTRIIQDTLKERLGIHMPSFNKGFFEDIQYDAIPIGKFRIVSSVFRWYRPYAPGTHINFNLKLKSLKKDGCGIRLFLCVGKKETLIGSYSCDRSFKKFKIDGISISEETKYYLKPLFNNDKSEIIVDVIPSHNDAFMFLILGGIITFIVETLAILIATILIKIFGI